MNRLDLDQLDLTRVGGERERLDHEENRHARTCWVEWLFHVVWTLFVAWAMAKAIRGG